MHLSPLRYPGGKSVLSDRITAILLKNHFLGGTFVEPFCGGAGVSLSLLYEERVSNVVLNDLDPRVYAFWFAVLRYTDDFCADLVKVPVTMEEWRKQKVISEHPNDFASYHVGFAAFYMNRCNRSGILGGGQIGGVEQDGEYTLDSRFNKEILISRIERLGRYRDRVEVYNLDAVDLLNKHVAPMTGNTMVYLDPPYFDKGKSLYRNFFGMEDHQRLASFLTSDFSHPWVLSYDAVPEIAALYEGCKSHILEVPYSAHSSKVGKEVLYFGSCTTPMNSS